MRATNSNLNRKFGEIVKQHVMNIQTEKLNLIEWISRLNDMSVIDKLKEIKDDYSKSKDWWDTLNKEEIESIKRGLKDFEEGKIHSHETARKIYEKYL
jgi:hypothetical protein